MAVPENATRGQRAGHREALVKKRFLRCRGRLIRISLLARLDWTGCPGRHPSNPSLN